MNILVDYDGTLIKTKEEDFTKMYFVTLAKELKMDPKYLGELIMEITKDLIKNQNGKESIYNQFINKIVDKTDKSIEKWEEDFTSYYQSGFTFLKDHILPNSKLIESLKNTNNKLFFASNPLFPKIAVSKRLAFIGMKLTDFEYVAYMENSYWLKPNPKFFVEILEKNNLEPSQCIMIGDTDFDRSCEKAGIKFIDVKDEDRWLEYLS